MEGRHVWQVTTTVDSRDAAEALALGAVGARLAACAQVGAEMRSIYWWNGELETAAEWPVVFKTTSARYGALEAYVRQAHPYEVPEILAVNVVAGSPSYLAWLRAETAEPAEPDPVA